MADEPLSINVDGVVIEVEAGEVIIAATDRAGIYVPRFCYHPRLRPVGMCRMCLVEVAGPRGMALQPACFVAVADGMEVVTKSPTVKAAQDSVLELLLVNHPLDCPVCDKGGECPLQDQTMAYGPGESRFVEEKRHWAKPIALSPLVDLDRERCIQCDRCTRFADDIAGDPLIQFIGRGARIEVNTFPDEPFASYFSGNTVQLCPVGALLAKPYRFKARPWDLEQVESTCTQCAVGCRIAVQASQDDLTRYLGVDSDPVNQGWLCDKGRFSYDAVNSPARLGRPLLRAARGGELCDATWADALDAAASALADAVKVHGPSSVGFLGGARLANEDAFAWAKLAKQVLGTGNTDAQLGDGLPAEVVLGLPRATIDEACAASTVILLAPDLKEELPVLYLRLRGAVVSGRTKLVELSSSSSGLTRYASATMPFLPGEAALAARALLDGDVRTSLGDSPVVVLGRPSVAEPAAGIVDAAATLRDGLPGVRFLSALRRGNVRGALEVGMAPGPGGLDAEGILRSAAEGKLQALVLVGADVMSDFPDAALVVQALDRVETVVAVDGFPNPTVQRFANVVLPAAGFAERAGTTTNLEGRVTRLATKVTAPGVAWPDWMIASELATRLGGDLGFESLDDITEAINDRFVRPDGASVDTFGQMRPGAAWTESPEPTPVPKPDAYGFRLAVGRKLYDGGVMVANTPALAGLVCDPVARVNPADLERLGVPGGGRVRIKGASLHMDVDVTADAAQARGSVWLPFMPVVAGWIDAAATANYVSLELIA